MTGEVKDVEYENYQEIYMRYFKNEQINYSNEFYVYDIESTKYEENSDTPIMGYSYLHGIKKYIF